MFVLGVFCLFFLEHVRRFQGSVVVDASVKGVSGEFEE